LVSRRLALVVVMTGLGLEKRGMKSAATSKNS
jgi:hypothetical protein